MPCDSSYSIKTDDDRVLLTIEQYSTSGGMDSDRSTNDNQHKTAGPAQNSPAHKSTHQHPWDAILDRTPSVFCSTRTTPRETVSENECNDIRHTASQCTTMDTTTEPSPTAGSSYNVPTHVPMTDSMEDEIATQGLFDGLDELYNFGDAQPDSYLQFANNPANTADDTHRSSPKRGTSEEVSIRCSRVPSRQLSSSTDSHSSHTTVLAPQAQQKSNSRPNIDIEVHKRASVGKESDKRDRLSAMDKECLADMSDDAANKIIATMGGFSAVRSGTTIACKGINGNKTEELTDMSDMEAQCIIGDLGGFAKPRILSAKDSSASVASEHKLAEHEPNKMTRQLPPYPSTPSTATVAGYMGSGVDESAGQKTQSPFPSNKDVLSARRALRMDSGKATTAQSNVPTRLTGLGQTTRGRSNPENQLRFKSPSLKRPAVRSQFNSPSKRPLTRKDNACNDGTSAAGALRKSPARLLQFSKPFRSPARISNTGSAGLPQTTSVSLHQRPPPRLPPVNRKEPTKLDKWGAACIPPSSTKHGPDKTRQTVADLGRLVDVGSRDNMPMEILSVTSESARGYVFPLGVAGQFWGASEARQTLVARGCIPSVITETWVRNHYRWSVWSAASYARRFPTRWKEFWSVEAILNRMLYRYEREYTRGGRSALRMIFEGDASAKQLMVLCVASICAKEGSFGVEVTDGWYSIRSSIDPILAQAIRNGRLREGDKIACAGLRVEGVSEGIPPLSGKAGDALLFITGNSVRRARWHAKLGFQYKRTMFMSLSGIYELGGPVGATIDVIIVRSYPMLYMEMTTGGQKVIRTEKEELKVALVFEEKKAALLQSLLGRRRQNEECARRSSSAASSVKILDASCMDGEILYNSIISTNAEPADAQNMLSDDQREALERYIVLKQDEDQAAVNEAVEKTMPSRQVHALFKLSLCDYPTHTYKSVETNASRTAVVTMWRPQNMTPSDFKEGSRFLMSGLTVSVSSDRRRYLQDLAELRDQRQTEGHVQLNFSPSTSCLKPMDAAPDLVFQSEYRERSVLHMDELRHLETGQEVDVTGNVESCSPCEAGYATSICLSGSDECGRTYHATIEFNSATFGGISLDIGKQVVVRNCWFVSPRPGDGSRHSFILRAEPFTEIASHGCEK